MPGAHLKRLGADGQAREDLDHVEVLGDERGGVHEAHGGLGKLPERGVLRGNVLQPREAQVRAVAVALSDAALQVEHHKMVVAVALDLTRVTQDRVQVDGQRLHLSAKLVELLARHVALLLRVAAKDKNVEEGSDMKNTPRLART